MSKVKVRDHGGRGHISRAGKDLPTSIHQSRQAVVQMSNKKQIDLTLDDRTVHANGDLFKPPIQ